jgi:tripartite-type tricarboxylate transporter receptor subunit TctC
MVVAFPPGGVADIAARIYSARLSEAWSQPVLIDNRPGANGAIGAELAARAQPDGYTLLMATASELTVNPVFYPKLAYDTLRDFAPISLATHNPVVWIAGVATPYRTMGELIAAARAKPATLAFSSPGNGSTHHLATEALRISSGAALIHVPYKGGAPATAAVVGGDVPIGAVALAPALPHLKAGKIRILGIASPRRSALLPEVPTLAETGHPVEMSNWVGLLAPARVPSAVIARINSDMVQLAASTDIRDRFAAQGSEAVSTTPEGFAAFIRAELAKFATIVRAADIKPD